jgi:AAA+ superfamily predicted ATPase
MGHFSVKSKIKLDDIELNAKIEESDYATITPEGTFVQLQYEEDEDQGNKYEVKPGIWSIQKSRGALILDKASFVSDAILDSFVSTKEITDKIDCFFRNLHVYKKFGIEVPKRGILLYGPAGSGKTTTLVKVSNTYSQDGKTAIIIWSTDKFEAYHVKDFVKTFEYKGVEKVILVVEDIGGIEMDERKHPSDSSLLSLLDNKEKIFKIPILILATTNFIEVFLGNLTNRPDRFDDKIEVGLPTPEHRESLFKFFAKDEMPQDILDIIKSNKCKEFSPAHLREVVIRTAIYEKDMKTVIDEVHEDIEKYKKSFQKKNSKMGFDG